MAAIVADEVHEPRMQLLAARFADDEESAADMRPGSPYGIWAPKLIREPAVALEYRID